MRIRVSSPNGDLSAQELDQFERDLEKIARRLHEYDDREEILAQVRVKENEEGPNNHVTIELHYGRNHLRTTETGSADVHQLTREARDELLRQINDRSRRGHSSFAKGT
jgi:ribosome-associated translation inhibitor RaiA